MPLWESEAFAPPSLDQSRHAGRKHDQMQDTEWPNVIALIMRTTPLLMCRIDDVTKRLASNWNPFRAQVAKVAYCHWRSSVGVTSVAACSLTRCHVLVAPCYCDLTPGPDWSLRHVAQQVPHACQSPIIFNRVPDDNGLSSSS